MKNNSKTVPWKSWLALCWLLYCMPLLVTAKQSQDLWEIEPLAGCTDEIVVTAKAPSQLIICPTRKSVSTSCTEYSWKTKRVGSDCARGALHNCWPNESEHENNKPGQIVGYYTYYHYSPTFDRESLRINGIQIAGNCVNIIQLANGRVVTNYNEAKFILEEFNLGGDQDPGVDCTSSSTLVDGRDLRIIDADGGIVYSQFIPDGQELPDVTKNTVLLDVVANASGCIPRCELPEQSPNCFRYRNPSLSDWQVICLEEDDVPVPMLIEKEDGNYDFVVRSKKSGMLVHSRPDYNLMPQFQVGQMVTTYSNGLPISLDCAEDMPGFEDLSWRDIPVKLNRLNEEGGGCGIAFDGAGEYVVTCLDGPCIDQAATPYLKLAASTALQGKLSIVGDLVIIILDANACSPSLWNPPSGRYADSSASIPTGAIDDLQNTIETMVSPNPFTSKFSVSYVLEQDTEVSIQVYDLMGKLVASPLRAQEKLAGEYQFTLDGSDWEHGLYIVLIQKGDQAISQRVYKTK
ncbi:MAG: T9SS type A sorting domain-containing protein [Flammeovirgaceae bacterium]